MAILKALSDPLWSLSHSSLILSFAAFSSLSATFNIPEGLRSACIVYFRKFALPWLRQQLHSPLVPTRPTNHLPSMLYSAAHHEELAVKLKQFLENEKTNKEAEDQPSKEADFLMLKLNLEKSRY